MSKIFTDTCSDTIEVATGDNGDLWLNSSNSDGESVEIYLDAETAEKFIKYLTGEEQDK